MTLTKIRKRDGRLAEFNEEKIARAIEKAFNATYKPGRGEEARKLADEVLSILEVEGQAQPDVEHIQDLVERVLMDNGYVQTAKSYILYREERSRAREMNTRLMKTYEDITFSKAKDSDIKRENANINADTAAGAVAAALHAHKAIFLTDVDGLYKDFSDKDSLISNLTLDEVNEMLYGGEGDKGMIPKLRAAVDALTGGVFRAHIINGTTPHSLLLELLTDAGVGTVIHSTETAYEFDTHPHPLSTFAARLTENLDEVEKLQTV